MSTESAAFGVRARSIERAHVVGTSMGGMIGQTMAIERPERVLSLASMMSTTGDRVVGTRLDHDANVTPWRLACDQAGAEHVLAPFDPATGVLDPATVIAEVDLTGLAAGRHVLPVRAGVGGTLTTTLVRPPVVTVLIR